MDTGMNILIAVAELTPLVSSGGLADVVNSLSKAWKAAGHNPVIVLPKHAKIDVKKYNFKPIDKTICIPVSYWMEYAKLWTGYLPGSDVPVYLVENSDYFDREGIYGNPNEYQDNDRRFIFFSRAVFETAKSINFVPDILHAHDYHTAFTMAFLKTHYRNDPFFSHCAGVFTIHNLAYQGWFRPETAMIYACFGTDGFKGSWFEKNDSVNCMKTGIMFADKITTVSPTYSREIRWDSFSEGLQYELNSRGGDLIGVLNGADYSTWNPQTDSYIDTKYSVDSLQNKQKNKEKFLREHNMDLGNMLNLPLIGMVTRLAEQKGIDILMHSLEYNLYHSRFFFCLLGSGAEQYEEYFNYLAWKYPNKISVHIGFNHELSHRIIASSDFLLLPSRFEPCGLTQMYALKYGTIPIVRSTGGLSDTVQEYTTYNRNGNGFLFINYNSDDMEFAIRRGMDIYYNTEHWDKVRANAMNCNFSITRAAAKYIEVFNWALEKIN